MACQLRKKADSTDFEADTNADVTLIAEDHIGSVMIAKAKYGDTDLIPGGTAASSVKFKVENGNKTLVLVYVFAPQGAMGELMEDCGDTKKHLRDIAGDEPRQSFDIEGK